MRIARKLTLLAMLALAATALAAPSAFAQVEPLAHNQNPQIIVQGEVHGNTDTNCPNVTPSPAPPVAPTATTGGCIQHAFATSVQLFAHLTAGGTEVLTSNCNVEVDIRIDSAGEGYLTHHELTAPTGGGGGTCTKRPCQTVPPLGESKAWSFYMRELEPAPTERVTVLFCVENLDGTQPSHCEITVPFTEPTVHNYAFTLNDVSGHGAIFPHCELGSAAQPATFNTETTLGITGEGGTEQRLEVRHQ